MSSYIKQAGYWHVYFTAEIDNVAKLREKRNNFHLGLD